MTDLSPTFSGFFKSSHKTLAEYKQALLESASVNAWAEAVNLWRAGLKKMKEKDLTGLDDIKKANEALKTAVNNKKPDGADKALTHLNESVEHFNKDNLDEEIEMLEYQVGSIVDKLAENGMAFEEENDHDEDDEFELMGCVETPAETQPANHQKDELEVEPSEDKEEPVKEDMSHSSPEMPTPAVVSSTTTPAPVEQTPVVEVVKPKKSGYAEGFAAGQARYKKGEKVKDMVKKIVEGEIYEQPYAFVQRYQEGFAAGFSYQEEVNRDLNPSLYEEMESGDK